MGYFPKTETMYRSEGDEAVSVESHLPPPSWPGLSQVKASPLRVPHSTNCPGQPGSTRPDTVFCPAFPSNARRVARAGPHTATCLGGRRQGCVQPLSSVPWTEWPRVDLWALRSGLSPDMLRMPDLQDRVRKKQGEQVRMLLFAFQWEELNPGPCTC